MDPEHRCDARALDGGPAKAMNAVLNAVRRYARSMPTATALAARDRSLTYVDLSVSIAAWARFLLQNEIRVLSILADNSPEWICVDLGARLAGIAVVPLPAFFSREQILHALRDSGADGIVTDASRAADLFERPEQCRLLPHAPGAGLVVWRVAREAVELPPGTVKISYTSGTTGRPKGVCLSQHAMEAVACSLESATRGLDLEQHLCLLPLPVLLENVAGVYAPLLAGARLVVPSLADIGWTGSVSLDPERLMAMLWETAPSSVILLPQMLRMLLAAIEAGARLPASLRFCAVGGGRTPTQVVTHARARGLPVFEGYGLTESASVVTLNLPGADRRGSVGRPLPHARVSVARNGELLVAGAGMLGYVGEDRARDARWLPTGDLGCIDEAGYVYVQGRRSNIFINSFGRNVSPDWVEPEFLRNGCIRQIAIFGESRPWNVAVVVPGRRSTDDEIRREIDTVNSELPDYARIGQWIRAAEPFDPKNGLLTVNGRVRRSAVWTAYRHRINDCYEQCLIRSA
jgi:long-chain acyl-CoA synthetase